MAVICLHARLGLCPAVLKAVLVSAGFVVNCWCIFICLFFLPHPHINWLQAFHSSFWLECKLRWWALVYRLTAGPHGNVYKVGPRWQLKWTELWYNLEFLLHDVFLCSHGNNKPHWRSTVEPFVVASWIFHCLMGCVSHWCWYSFNPSFSSAHVLLLFSSLVLCLQCFDVVGWAAGRASIL